MLEILVHYKLLEGLEKRGDEWVGCCPICDREGEYENDSFRANIVKNNWYCFASDCKKKGNVLDFVAEMEKTNIKEAAQLIAGWYLKPSESSQKPSQGEKEKGIGQTIGRIWVEDAEKRRIYFPVTKEDFEAGPGVIGKKAVIAIKELERISKKLT